MKIDVHIKLTIDAPDSTGFSMDVMNLVDQILRDMLDINSPKREQLHAIFDGEASKMEGAFECDYDFMTAESKGSYTVTTDIDPTFDFGDKWYTSQEDRTNALLAGYKVESSNWGDNKWMPVRPDGTAITRGPCPNKHVAWWYVVSDHKGASNG